MPHLPEHLQAFTEEIPVLDHGYVQLLDVMGDDDIAILEAARTSYGNEAKGTHQYKWGARQENRPCIHCGIPRNDLEDKWCQPRDQSLIRYLYRHRHSTPFESCRIKLRIKLPIFVERQWARHRTAGWSEMSGRYIEMPEEFYVPDPEVRPMMQAKKNKQGAEPGSEGLVSSAARRFVGGLPEEGQRAFRGYSQAVSEGVAKEIARIDLPLSTYTIKVWWVDLRNLLGFQGLRMDPHAQWEIRQYANEIAKIVQAWMPWTWQAFEDYELNAVTFSGPEMEVLREFFAANDGLTGAPRQWMLDRLTAHPRISKRESAAFLGLFGEE